MSDDILTPSEKLERSCADLKARHERLRLAGRALLDSYGPHGTGKPPGLDATVRRALREFEAALGEAE